MNHAMVAYISGRILILVGCLMSSSLFVSFCYKETILYKSALLIAVILTLLVGGMLSHKKPNNMRIYVREGLVITSLCWLLLAIAGALPYYITGVVPTFVDAFFESASGFTTTGSTIFTEIESLPHSILFWRSFTHFIGGMGVLVFALAVLPEAGGQHVHLMKAETTGPSFGKLVSHLRQTARILYIIYAVMTLALAIILFFSGMNLFDSIIHAFSTAGTGGFSSKNASIAAYNSPLIEYILAIAMLVFGVNFSLYFFLIQGQVKEILRSEELKWYLGIVLVATISLVCVLSGSYDSLSKCIRDSFFTVATIITTTGFGTIDFDKWPLFCHMIILMLMFVGGCAGSTAGGIKVSRVMRMVKISKSHFRRVRDPKRVVPVMAEGKIVNQTAQNEIGVYLILYVLIFVVLMLIVSFDKIDFTTAFSAVAGTFNNIGPGLGAVGPTCNFASLSDVSKVALSIGMIAGRLELFPVLVFFAPATWRLK